MKKTHSMVIQLPVEINSALERLARLDGSAKVVVIRRLIRLEAEREFGERPVSQPEPEREPA